MLMRELEAGPEGVLYLELLEVRYDRSHDTTAAAARHVLVDATDVTSSRGQVQTSAYHGHAQLTCTCGSFVGGFCCIGTSGTRHPSAARACIPSSVNACMHS